MKNSIYGNAAAALLFVALAACLAQAGNVIVKNGQLNAAF